MGRVVGCDPELELYYRFGKAFQKKDYHVRYLRVAGKTGFEFIRKVVKKKETAAEVSLCRRLMAVSERISNIASDYNPSLSVGNRRNLLDISKASAGIISGNRWMILLMYFLLILWAALWFGIHWYLMVEAERHNKTTGFQLALSLPLSSIWRYGDRYLRRWISGIGEISKTAEIVRRISEHLTSIIEKLVLAESPVDLEASTSTSTSTSTPFA